jgi:hypothetical protein
MELARRELFRQACEQLVAAPNEAEKCFREASATEVYLEEIEALCREQASALARHPETARRLRDLFIGAYRYKHDLDKYQTVPEGLRVQWRQDGLARIKECFHAILPS